MGLGAAVAQAFIDRVNPKPYTLHPKSQTRNPQPLTLNLNPKP